MAIVVALLIVGILASLRMSIMSSSREAAAKAQAEHMRALITDRARRHSAALKKLAGEDADEKSSLNDMPMVELGEYLSRLYRLGALDPYQIGSATAPEDGSDGSDAS